MIFKILAFLSVCGFMFQLYTLKKENIPCILIDNVTAIRNVSKNFLSVTIDTHLIRDGLICITNSEIFLKRSIPLAPAFLRVGGTDADRLIFVEELPHYINCSFLATQEMRADLYGRTLFSMSDMVWSEIYSFTQKAGFSLIFDLNVLLRKENSWDPSNALLIFNYSSAHNYEVIWQLGNEPNSFKHVFGTEVDPQQLGEDFKHLRKLLENFQTYQKPFIIGPDITRPKNLDADAVQFLHKFLCSIDNITIDAVSWHQYYIRGETATTFDFINPETLNILEEQIKAIYHVVKECRPHTPIWLTETSSASSGGAPGLSDSYIAGFLWLDKLGIAASSGIDIVIRQSLYGGHYSLLDLQNLEPLPDWWLSVLYKKLVGQIVLNLEPFLKRNGPLRLYAHCSSEEEKHLKGSIITLFGMNLRNQTSYITITKNINSKLKQTYISAYILTGSDLLSKFINLNGQRLSLLPDGSTSDFIPTIQDISSPIELPPLSYGFWTIHGVTLESCL